MEGLKRIKDYFLLPLFGPASWYVVEQVVKAMDEKRKLHVALIKATCTRRTRKYRHMRRWALWSGVSTRRKSMRR